jgi:[glutamine synthetase] adenylyltransferase / [glutamine synthetase]-adenylyl-L-tyrosine phosphorylase
MKVSDYLTWLAEAILEEVLALAWRHTVARHGQPQRVDGSLCDPAFIILGYGKVGGIELGHGSDLDLVFIHDGDPQAETDGAKPIDGAQFFTRLGQRIIHLLTTQTNSGQLYEVDMRLRPSGASGLLVSSLGAFDRYQQRGGLDLGASGPGARAGTWWAARMLGQAISSRYGLTCWGAERDLGEAAPGGQRDACQDARQPGHQGHDGRQGLPMPSRPRRCSTSSRTPVVSWISNLWCNTRLWRGLRQHPHRCCATPTISAFWMGLEQAGLMTGDEVRLLQDAYKAYRAAAHRQSLQKLPGVVSGDQFHDERRAVMRIWRELGLS